jgi:hypothetical protein
VQLLNVCLSCFLFVPQLLTVCQALGHLGAPPPQDWLLNFYAATRPFLRSLDVVGISNLVHGTARLPLRPGQGWLAELLLGEWVSLQRCC